MREIAGHVVSTLLMAALLVGALVVATGGTVFANLSWG